MTTPDLFAGLQITRAQAIEVLPTDVVLLRTEQRLSRDQINRVTTELRAALGLPDIKVIVTDYSYTLDFVRPRK